MNKDFIAVNSPLITDQDRQSVAQVLEEGWISGEGPFVEEFEATIAKMTNRRHGIAVSNGSVALDLTFAALGIGPGDEVILPTFTIISCLSHIIRSGATPIFVDADPLTWNLKVNDVERLISSNTKAILAVHIYGLPVDMNPLIEICDRHGITLIEDAAQAHGLKYRGIPCGSMGFASTFSFYANKNISCGEGGMVLTNDDEFAARIRNLRNLAFSTKRRFLHDELGWNARLSSMQAALGTSQAKRLDATLSRKKEIADKYREALTGIDEITLPQAVTDYAENSYWVFGILLGTKRWGNAETFQNRLNDLGVGTRPFFYPLHSQPVLNYSGAWFPIAESLGETGFYLPGGSGISDYQINQVIERVLFVFEQD